MSTTKRSFGWRPDRPDHRDLDASLKMLGAALPIKVDLRGKCPPIYHEGNLGSCTANACGGALQFTEMEEHKKGSIPSRLFIYFNTRTIEGTPNEDSGASIRDTFKAVNKQGYCREAKWPYMISKFMKKPPKDCYDEAAGHKVMAYARLSQTELALKDALAAGDPVTFGFTVYESFGPDKNGVIKMPSKNESVLGGHAILLVGYDFDRRLFLFRNSWGESWGLKGYAWMPFDYVLNPRLASDFWVLRAVP